MPDSYHFIRTETKDLSYETMEKYLNSELSAKGPLTPSEERHAAHEIAINTLGAVREGFLPTNGLTPRQLEHRDEAIQDNYISREATVASMSRAVEDWQHDHNHAPKHEAQKERTHTHEMEP